MLEYADNLDRRTDEHQQTVVNEFVANMTAMRTEVEGNITHMRTGVESALVESMKQNSQYIGGLDAGIRGLNTALEKLGAQQIVVHEVKKKRWWSRG
jgi:gamma-glutamyl:cysteine ligase YbdK (ATP-grasp superfamily)